MGVQTVENVFTGSQVLGCRQNNCLFFLYLLGLVLHVLAQEQFGVHIDGLGVLHQVGGALGSAGGAHAQGGGGGVGVRLVQILQSLV